MTSCLFAADDQPPSVEQQMEADRKTITHSVAYQEGNFPWKRNVTIEKTIVENSEEAEEPESITYFRKHGSTTLLGITSNLMARSPDDLRASITCTKYPKIGTIKGAYNSSDPWLHESPSLHPLTEEESKEQFDLLEALYNQLLVAKQKK